MSDKKNICFALKVKIFMKNKNGLFKCSSCCETEDNDNYVYWSIFEINFIINVNFYFDVIWCELPKCTSLLYINYQQIFFATQSISCEIIY